MANLGFEATPETAAAVFTAGSVEVVGFGSSDWPNLAKGMLER